MDVAADLCCGAGVLPHHWRRYEIYNPGGPHRRVDIVDLRFVGGTAGGGGHRPVAVDPALWRGGFRDWCGDV